MRLRNMDLHVRLSKVGHSTSIEQVSGKLVALNVAKFCKTLCAKGVVPSYLVNMSSLSVVWVSFEGTLVSLKRYVA
jgi:hypothetical protein